jgi:hypothetical protein
VRFACFNYRAAGVAPCGRLVTGWGGEVVGGVEGGGRAPPARRDGRRWRWHRQGGFHLSSAWM